MSNYSRVKKYEELRSQIEVEKDQQIQVRPLSIKKDQLFETKPKDFSNPVPAQREKSERKPEPVLEQSNFENEYLDDFIKEVKRYNMERGLRDEENTQLNILNSIKNIQPRNKAYFEPMEREEAGSEETLLIPKEQLDVVEKSVEGFEAIRDEIAEMIQSVEVEEQEPLHLQTIIQDLGELEHDPLLENLDDVQEEATPAQLTQEQPVVDISNEQSDLVLEETKQLRIAIEEYGDEIEDIQSDLGKTNKVLNWILGILIFTLFTIVAMIALWVMKLGGVI
ncbi:MAG: hypothetical protein ACRCZJ_03710 [Erysipelotrichaceae bacterium]